MTAQNRGEDMTIERATIDDAEEILQLQKLAYRSEAEIYHDFEIEPRMQTVDDTILELKTKIVLKAIDESKIVGSVRAISDGNTCFIGKLIVHPDFQNRGLGTELMISIEKMFEGVERFELFTGHLSAKNLHLYKKLGYKRFGEKQVTEKLKLVSLEKFLK